ncbi:CatB-related O-acetyltransferase [Helicobacter sp. MIT 14-3879]|uniref:CatB-related O-acetyltransferase n=1 Tax=Helicobacter sp. MIT 14-3879 TaxID=2040649 RepID=UPI000E1E90C6|nr:CatB-related O-acetyltransferase [Helicobacter sp. MIT 14-3879]RDU61711.1 acetyltransferase [Helicobacter sp. MIT 14-3879]
MIKEIFNILKLKLYNKREMNRFIREFREKNLHNHTFPVSRFILENVSIGKATYGPIEVLDYGNKNAKVRIGNFCSIAANVKFLSGGGHNINTLSTYPFYAYFSQKEEENTTKGLISIGDDCWIGRDSIICSGCNIPQGCIIGAGSVVRGNFEPYSIIIGNPAICIKKRFVKEIIDILLDIDFSLIDKDFISHNFKNLYMPLDKNLALYFRDEIKSKYKL